MIKTLLVVCTLGLCLHGSALNSDSLRPLSHYLVLNAGYRLPLNNAGVINSGHGLYLEAGLNLGRFFNSRTTIALFGGFAAQDRLWNTSFRSGYAGLSLHYEYYNLHASPLYFDNGEQKKMLALKSFTSHAFLHRTGMMMLLA